MDTIPAQTVDVKAIMREIHARLRGDTREHEFLRQARKTVPSHLTSTIARLRSSTASLKSAVAAIGEVPPSPPTLRGRLGLILVRLAQRGAFWLVPSIRISQNQIVDTLEKHLLATEEMLEALRQTNIELARLRSLVQPESTAGADLAPGGGGRR